MDDYILKNGTSVADQRLDRLVQFDERSRNYPAIRGTSVAGKPFRSYTWRIGEANLLDQGAEGRCVEYSICHELLARPAYVPRHEVDRILAGKEIYWPAQREDQWEGGSYPGASPVYEGTSVLAGIKVAARMGYYKGYRWAFGVEELALAVGYRGPAVLGVNWYEGFFDTDDQGFIRIGDTRVAGGHAILCAAVRVVKHPETGALERAHSYFTLVNSWGPGWGDRGKCRIGWNDLDRLLRENGECCIPDVRRKHRI